MDSVRAVRTSGYDAMQKPNRVAFLQNLDALVSDARQPFGERGELVVVSGEKRAAAKLRRVVQVLDHGLRDRNAVVGRRPPSHLVEDHQGRSRRVIEDVGGFGRLDQRMPASLDAQLRPRVHLWAMPGML